MSMILCLAHEPIPSGKQCPCNADIKWKPADGEFLFMVLQYYLLWFAKTYFWNCIYIFPFHKYHSQKGFSSNQQSNLATSKHEKESMAILLFALTSGNACIWMRAITILMTHSENSDLGKASNAQSYLPTKPICSSSISVFQIRAALH